MPYPESTPVGIIRGVGEKTREIYDHLGIRTLGDLLRWYPRTYINALEPHPIGNAPYGYEIAIRARISSIGQRRSAKTRVMMVEAIVHDGTGEATVRWFNQPYLMQKLIPGSEWTLIGEMQYFNGHKSMLSPVIEEKPGIFPVYRQSSSLTSRMQRQYIGWALDNVELNSDPLPEEIRLEKKIKGYQSTIKNIHQPQNMDEVREAQYRLAFDEVFSFFTRTRKARQVQDKKKGIQIGENVELLKQIVENLPFTLTPAQKRAVWECVQEMASGKVMTRLLNGDVGSGKTVVAALCSAVVAQAGYQTVLLVPTEILAQQHRERLEVLLGPKFTYATWTSAQKDEKISDADIVIGTHAVLFKAFTLPRLGLVVIDEQHRFGVKQRQHLRKQQETPPHVLSMTATPIPRTLALTLYGDLSLSVLNQKPAGRLPIITDIILPRERERLREHMRNEVKSGHQVVVVCPLIQKDDSLEVPDARLERTTVEKEADRLRKEEPGLGVVEIIHGKLSPAQKQAVMKRMADGDINVLVATTVIEVGIDLPNLTMMVIEGAESFGLAQIHQLRGRVGRSDQQSYCYLCPTVSAPTFIQRLRILVENDDGFAVAEADLQLRGPGDLGGLSQSGLPDFKMARLTDLHFLNEVRETVEKYMEKHPDFKTSPDAEDYSSDLLFLE